MVNNFPLTVHVYLTRHRDVRVGTKLGQICRKWDKSRTLQISCQYGSPSQNVQKTDTGIIEKSHVCPICGQSDSIWDHF